MKRVVTSVVLGTFLVGGCEPKDDVEAIRQALPQADSMKVKVPDNGARALGQTALFYEITRKVSLDLNSGAAAVLLLVRTIVAFPATSVEGDVYVWGPWTDALSPSEHRLTVSRREDGGFVWSLEGRRKNTGDDYQSVVYGVAHPGEVAFRGEGEFTMDFDVAERLDPVANDASGQLSVVYDLTAEPRTVVMDYVRPETPPGGVAQDVSLHYEYREAEIGGVFLYELNGDLDDNGSAWESLTINSQWMASGAGKSEFRVVGGDLVDLTLQGIECWDTSFARVYWTDSLGWGSEEGSPSSCAIPTR